MADAVPFTISSAADLVDISIQDIWLKGSEKESKDYAKFCNTETGISDLYVKDSSLSGLGYAGRILEGEIITAQSPIQGYDKTYTQVEFGIILAVTKQNWKFGIKKRNLERITTEARKACADLRERRLAEMLPNGHSTSYTTEDESGNYTVYSIGGNSVELFSDAQTREDGGTDNNNQVYDGTTTNMDFEYDALKAAHRTAALIRNPKGKPMNINLDTLVFPRGYSNYFRAIEMLGALKKGWMPGTAEHEGGGIPQYKIVDTPWILSNTDYWYMFDSSMKNATYGLQYKESQPITMEGPNIVFKSGEIQYKATMMFDFGFNDYRGWVGSTNLNT